MENYRPSPIDVDVSAKSYISNPWMLIGLTLFFSACQPKEVRNTKPFKSQAETDRLLFPEDSSSDIVFFTEPTTDPIFELDTFKYLSEKVLLNYISMAGVITPSVKNGVPFDTLRYNRIIAYDFAGEEESFADAIENGKFVPVILKQQYLNQQQADNILSTLTKPGTYGGITAACFRPHLALVFFNGETMVDQISICLDCNYLASNLTIPAETHNISGKGTESERILYGFSRSGKSAIINFCKGLDFSYARTAN